MSKDKTINPAELPQSEAYNDKEIHQHKHLADTGKPLDEQDKMSETTKGKPANKTTREEGLNEENLNGNTPALKDQGDI